MEVGPGTVGDVERVGIEKIAETALEIAWKGAKAVYLSFDIDGIDDAHKLSILASLAFGTRPAFAEVAATGIRHVLAADIDPFCAAAVAVPCGTAPGPPAEASSPNGF